LALFVVVEPPNALDRFTKIVVEIAIITHPNRKDVTLELFHFIIHSLWSFVNKLWNQID